MKYWFLYLLLIDRNVFGLVVAPIFTNQKVLAKLIQISQDTAVVELLAK